MVYVLCRISYVVFRMSYVICHMSYVIEEAMVIWSYGHMVIWKGVVRLCHMGYAMAEACNTVLGW
jgi:hypothetical protein